jgi:hypothetical protein
VLATLVHLRTGLTHEAKHWVSVLPVSSLSVIFVTLPDGW